MMLFYVQTSLPLLPPSPSQRRTFAARRRITSTRARTTTSAGRTSRRGSRPRGPGSSCSSTPGPGPGPGSRLPTTSRQVKKKCCGDFGYVVDLTQSLKMFLLLLGTYYNIVTARIIVIVAAISCVLYISIILYIKNQLQNT